MISNGSKAKWSAKQLSPDSLFFSGTLVQLAHEEVHTSEKSYQQLSCCSGLLWTAFPCGRQQNTFFHRSIFFNLWGLPSTAKKYTNKTKIVITNLGGYVTDWSWSGRPGDWETWSSVGQHFVHREGWHAPRRKIHLLTVLRKARHSHATRYRQWVNKKWCHY